MLPASLPHVYTWLVIGERGKGKGFGAHFGMSVGAAAALGIKVVGWVSRWRDRIKKEREEGRIMRRKVSGKGNERVGLGESHCTKFRSNFCDKTVRFRPDEVGRIWSGWRKRALEISMLSALSFLFRTPLFLENFNDRSFFPADSLCIFIFKVKRIFFAEQYYFLFLTVAVSCTGDDGRELSVSRRGESKDLQLEK